MVFFLAVSINVDERWFNLIFFIYQHPLALHQKTIEHAPNNEIEFMPFVVNIVILLMFFFSHLDCFFIENRIKCAHYFHENKNKSEIQNNVHCTRINKAKEERSRRIKYTV